MNKLLFGLQADFGDVSERKELIKKLKCHNFDWYLENVFPEKYVPENIEGLYGMVKIKLIVYNIYFDYLITSELLIVDSCEKKWKF